MDQPAKNLFLGDTLKTSMLVISIVVLAAFNWPTITAYLYWPFDHPPEVSFESAIDPTKQKKLMEEFCAYAKREEIRHPGIFIKAKREAACKKVQ